MNLKLPGHLGLESESSSDVVLDSTGSTTAISSTGFNCLTGSITRVVDSTGSATGSTMLLVGSTSPTVEGLSVSTGMQASFDVHLPPPLAWVTSEQPDKLVT